MASADLKPMRRLPTRNQGLAMVEFAVVVTVLLGLTLGITQFGWLLNRYTQVGNAAGSGARFFVSPKLINNVNAYNLTVNYVKTILPSLSANLAITTRVNGTLCTNAADAATNCGKLLAAATGGQATVSVTWTITPWMNVRIYGLDKMWPASYTATVAERIQPPL